jgi:hypothetical protein
VDGLLAIARICVPSTPLSAAPLQESYDDEGQEYHTRLPASLRPSFFGGTPTQPNPEFEKVPEFERVIKGCGVIQAQPAC